MTPLYFEVYQPSSSGRDSQDARYCVRIISLQPLSVSAVEFPGRVQLLVGDFGLLNRRICQELALAGLQQSISASLVG